MVAHSYNTSIQEAEAGNFEDSLSYKTKQKM
jgi:hypothetical protein